MRDPGPKETVLALLPVNRVERARVLFDLAIACLVETGLDENDAYSVIDGWVDGLGIDDEEEEEEDE